MANRQTSFDISVLGVPDGKPVQSRVVINVVDGVVEVPDVPGLPTPPQVLQWVGVSVAQIYGSTPGTRSFTLTSGAADKTGWVQPLDAWAAQHDPLGSMIVRVLRGQRYFVVCHAHEDANRRAYLVMYRVDDGATPPLTPDAYKGILDSTMMHGQSMNKYFTLSPLGSWIIEHTANNRQTIRGVPL